MLSNVTAHCLVGAALVFCVRPALAAEVDWRHDYATARAEARRASKPLFIDVYGSNCIPCKRLEVTTFRDARIVAVLNDRFIPVKLDGDKNMSFVEALQIDTYPMLLLADSNGSILDRHAGYLSADVLQPRLNSLLARLPKAQGPAQAVMQASGTRTPAAPAGPGAASFDLKVVKYRELIDSVRARRGKIVVIGLWEASRQAGLTHLFDLHQRYARNGVECLSVNVDAVEKKPALASLLRTRSAGLTHFLLDEEPGFWQEKMSVSSAPAVYVFAADGKLVCRYSHADGYQLEDIEQHIRKLIEPVR